MFGVRCPQGRGTGGVRSHRFLKGEDTVSIAWVGPLPARSVGMDGTPRSLPESGSRRDASGAMLDSVIGTIGAQIG